MMNKKTTTLNNEDYKGEKSVIGDMCFDMDDLYHYNQALEDNVLHIQQRQQKVDPTDEVEMLDSLSQKRYGKRPFYRNLSWFHWLSLIGEMTHMNMQSPSTRKWSSLAEMMTRAECYIKGKESKYEKKARDMKEHTSITNISQQSRKSQYTSPVKNRMMFKRIRIPIEKFIPMNTRQEQIWQELFHVHNIPQLSAPKAYVMGLEPNSWCKFRKFKGNDTNDCYQLKKEIQRMIQEGNLKKYVKGGFARGLFECNSQGRDA